MFFIFLIPFSCFFSKPPTSKKGPFLKKNIKSISSRQADEWLTTFQQTPAAWQVSDQLLSSPDTWRELNVVGGPWSSMWGWCMGWSCEVGSFFTLWSSEKKQPKEYWIYCKCPIWSLVLVITWICCVKRWLFKDCTMMNHHQQCPPFKRICVVLFPSIE